EIRRFQKIGVASDAPADVVADSLQRIPHIMDETRATLNAITNTCNGLKSFLADPNLHELISEIKNFTTSLKDFDIRNLSRLINSTRDGFYSFSFYMRILCFVFVPLLILHVFCHGLQ